VAEHVEDLRNLLEGHDHPHFHLPTVWRKREWVPVARDRVASYAAVTRVQLSGKDRFFAMTGVYVRTGSGWNLEFENGHLWPSSPANARPVHGQPIHALTHVSGAGVGARAQPVAFVAGVLTTSVVALRASSTVEEHLVDVDASTGIIVALTLQEQPIELSLTALDATGRELDVITFPAAPD
jgi:hypothetical protein